MAQSTPPALYPDAVTLRPGLSLAQVTASVADRPVCSVKDSYADLDLTSVGFDLLFEAQWIYREPAPEDAASRDWTIVKAPDALAEWSAEHGPPGCFPAEILDDPAVRFLVARDGDQIVGGAITNLSAGGIGVSNVFTTHLDGVMAWTDIIVAIAARFPALPVVGYEHGKNLTGALAAGFVEVGPLRIWIRRG